MLCKYRHFDKNMHSVPYKSCKKGSFTTLLGGAWSSQNNIPPFWVVIMKRMLYLCRDEVFVPDNMPHGLSFESSLQRPP